jgi:hypothetical protein
LPAFLFLVPYLKFTFATIKKLFKYLSFLLISILAILAVIIIFISPITEHLIEKYDTTYIHREVEMEDLSLNIFNGKLTIKQISVFEPKSKKKLLYIGHFFTQINPYKAAFSQEYDISAVKLNDFEVNISQRGSHFNFDDLLTLGESDTPKKPEVKSNDTTRWCLRYIELSNGKLNYNDQLVGANARLNHLKVICPGLFYNKPEMHFMLSTNVTGSGSVNTDFNLNSSTLAYTLKANINALQLNQFYPYLKEILKANDLQGALSTGFKAQGNFNRPEELALKGNLGISNFKIIDVLSDSLALFKQLNVSIDSINTKNNVFNLRNILLDEPYVKVDLFEDGTNFNRLLKVDSTTVETSVGTDTPGDSIVTNVNGSSTNIFLILADYVKSIAKDYILNSYSADNVILTNGTIDYSDFSLGEQFYARLDSLTINSSRISSSNSRISAKLSTLVNHEGKVAVDISANPKDFLEMDLNTTIQKVPMVMFNPYMLYYLAHPFKKGGFNFKTVTTINANHDLNSENALLMEKVKVGKRDKSITTATKVPLRMGVALLKDNKGNIDFKFPVTGNLNDPKYKLNKIIIKIFQNLLVKAVSSPFNALSGLLKKKEPETEFEFNYLQSQFNKKKQAKILERLVETLKDKPELMAEFIQNVNPDKEMEFLAYQEAKKVYLNETAAKVFNEPLSEDDIKLISGVQNKDSTFVQFVQSKVTKLSKLASHLDKCKNLVGVKELKNLHATLISSREMFIEKLFTDAGIDKTRLVFERNINKKSNLNQVKPILSFELDVRDEELAK